MSPPTLPCKPGPCPLFTPSPPPSVPRVMDLAGHCLPSPLLPHPPGSPTLPSVPRVMELAGYCRLLEELLELGTIRDCGEIFECMEADLEVWEVCEVCEGSWAPSGTVGRSLSACRRI